MPNIGRKIQAAEMPEVPRDFDPRLINILEQLIQAHDLREGRLAPRTNTRFVTIQDLVDAGVITDGDIT